MNKLFLNIILATAVAFCLGSCGYDNFDEPESMLAGNIQYNGQNLQLQGSAGSIQLQAYQSGYELKSPITINGPWVNKRDTVEVDVKGNTEVNIPVTPYFLLSDYNCSLSGNLLTVSFKIQQIVNTATMAYGTICIGRTSIVDEQNNAFQIRLNASALTMGANSFSFTLTDEQKKAISGAARLTARVGLRTVDADKSVYTHIVTLAE